MTEVFRSFIHPVIPSHFNDPASLALRIIRSRDPAAYSAVFHAALQALLMTVDLALGPLENKLYKRAKPPTLPIIFVVGAPRSGTTVFTQALISSLPIAYLNNLSALFPHAPILASKSVSRPFRNKQVECKSYYGKSRKWYGPHDSHYLWDRWLGSDRTLVPTKLPAGIPQQIESFFGAFEAAFQRPLATKNNMLNTCAHLIAPVLPTAVFVCVRRNPLYLAQSLLMARREIHGSDSIPYGLDDPRRRKHPEGDGFESVCRQIVYHRRQESLQIERIGADRFLIVEYEDFCREPRAILRQLVERVFGDQAWSAKQWMDLEPIRPNSAPVSRRLSARDFDRLKHALMDRDVYSNV